MKPHWSFLAGFYAVLGAVLALTIVAVIVVGALLLVLYRNVGQ